MAYSNDTRTLRPGDIYVAIRGERHDGHAFVDEAIRRGASGIVADRPVTACGLVPVQIVDDVPSHLAAEAAAKLSAVRPDVVAVTGSVGKTTTKQAIAAVLGQTYPVVSTPGNMNTPLGISLALLNGDITANTKVVLEMGATRRGDIAELCGMFPPTVSVVTNVHGVHLSSFGSLEAVAKTKAEIIGALPPTGVACLNGDAPLVRAMARFHAGRVLLYGREVGCDIRPEHITATLPLRGDHAIYVATAALAVARAVGMDDAAGNEGLSQLEPPKGRLRMLPGLAGTMLLDDTYNASPASLHVAFAFLRRMEARRRIAFLGDMLELGDDEPRAHQDAVNGAVRTADCVILVGPRMGRVYRTRIPSAAVVHVPTSTDAAAAVGSADFYVPRPGDAVLVKGSQGMRMERVSRALLREDIDPASVLVRQSAAWCQL